LLTVGILVAQVAEQVAAASDNIKHVVAHPSLSLSCRSRVGWVLAAHPPASDDWSNTRTTRGRLQAAYSYGSLKFSALEFALWHRFHGSQAGPRVDAGHSTASFAGRIACRSLVLA
jgi:hypothetical protein